MTNPLAREFAIPLLPCISINPTLEFYESLGFKVTYRQKAPNTYAVVKLRELELHFFVMKALVPENNFSSCYLVVADIDSMYGSFVSGLKQLYGKIPVKGMPRVNPLKDMPTYGVRQFIVVDPSGNYIRIGQPIPKTDSLVFKENNQKELSGSALEKAYELASRLLDGKGDLEAAAKVIDKVLETGDHPSDLLLLRVLILRTDTAIRREESTVGSWLVRAQELADSLEAGKIKEERRLLKELEDLVK